jgi:dienelactone hydrolase
MRIQEAGGIESSNLITTHAVCGQAMPKGEPNPTFRQILRAALKIARESLALPFHRRKSIKFMSGGQRIHACFYYARSNTTKHGILLLPTAFGLTPHEHAFAARLAREGYTTLVVGYSKRTTGAVIKDDLRRQNLEQIVLHSWQVLQSDPMVDADHTAVIGLSLGGYFAVNIATTVREFEPRAVVVYYGMYPLEPSKAANLRAPLLVLQGEDDYGDFVVNAKRVTEMSARSERSWEVVFYPGTGHQFDLFESGGAAAHDAWKRTVEFLGRNVGPSALNARKQI